jgi:hypothetical protein
MAEDEKAEEKTEESDDQVNHAAPDGGLPDQIGTLLDAASYNLNIAQQYIDSARFPAEHRLICFHYGIALLARYRAKPEMRALARQYFEMAVNWRVEENDENARRVFHRILAESYYNLGVIDELDGDYRSALDSYLNAILFAERGEQDTGSDGLFIGVRILATFGLVSATDLGIEGGAVPADPASGFLEGQMANLQALIETSRTTAPLALREPAVYVRERGARRERRAADEDGAVESAEVQNLLLRQIELRVEEIRRRRLG